MKSSNPILIAHPTTKDELSVIKAFLKALKIKFEETDKTAYNQDFVKKIKKARKEANRTEIDPNDVWGSLVLR